MTDAANGTRAMPMRKRMFSHTRVRFTRTTKWDTWWLANQYTPRTMKLMKNVANRDHKPPRSPARPPGPSVSGGADLQDEDRHRNREDPVNQRLEPILRQPAGHRLAGLRRPPRV